jgi:5-methylcytosine-specific restriction endonuclease McrA
MKTCTKCGEAKSLDNFHVDRSRKGGRNPACKPCVNARTNAYKRQNADKIRERRAADTGAQRERFARWTAANPEKNRERHARYRSENPGKIRAFKREWARSNPDKVSAYASRRRARVAGGAYEPYSRAEIFAAYGGACAYCDDPAEHLDHVKAISRGGADAAHNLLPACAPCNLGKGAKSLAEWAATF